MNNEREAFEAWCRSTNTIDWSRDKTSEANEYHKPYTQRAWLAWQAAVLWAAKMDAGVLLSEENDRLIEKFNRRPWGSISPDLSKQEKWAEWIGLFRELKRPNEKLGDLVLRAFRALKWVDAFADDAQRYSDLAGEFGSELIERTYDPTVPHVDRMRKA